MGSNTSVEWKKEVMLVKTSHLCSSSETAIPINKIAFVDKKSSFTRTELFLILLTVGLYYCYLQCSGWVCLVLSMDNGKDKVLWMKQQQRTELFRNIPERLVGTEEMV
eukprot:TRINITY_DN203_c0_g1_i2.p1 TRINITY_DN203_c0_g1~~TRINITY_DN203_c0_g1_i2.p1  ORF type:complete len:121 (+),score=24.06 TRINITY_DN203_c0_g1_i2:40-363(+)